MKLTFKDIRNILIVMIVSFPIMFFAMLLATGNLKLQFRQPVDAAGRPTEELKLMRMTHHRDSLAVIHAESFRALQRQIDSLKTVKEHLEAQEKRTRMVKAEIDRARQELAEERHKFENAVGVSDEASKKKIRQLAKVYGAMKPAEAAQLLSTLKDELAIEILKGMGDDRQKGKVMAALPKDFASRISKKMGKPAK